MTPAALAEQSILDEAAERVLRRKPSIMRDGPGAIMGEMASELARMLYEERRGGFDRSATLARAVEAKRAEGPAHL